MPALVKLPAPQHQNDQVPNVFRTPRSPERYDRKIPFGRRFGEKSNFSIISKSLEPRIIFPGAEIPKLPISGRRRLLQLSNFAPRCTPYISIHEKNVCRRRQAEYALSLSANISAPEQTNKSLAGRPANLHISRGLFRDKFFDDGSSEGEKKVQRATKCKSRREAIQHR